MGSTKNQAIEKHYFDLFRQHYELPPGEIEHSDLPDVVIHGEKKIGIEIARLYKTDGSDFRSEQQQSRDRLNIIELAEKNYLSKGGRKIDLYIGFNPDFPIKKERRNQIIEDLTEIALRVSLQRDDYVGINPLEDTPELGFLFHDGKERHNSKWRPGQSYDVPALSVARVKDMVKEKSEKLAGYKLCDAYWLLLIVEFWDPSQDQDIHWPSEESITRSPFERILIYKTTFNRVVEVEQR